MQNIRTIDPLEITSQEVRSYLRMRHYTQLTLIKEKLALFKKKYNCDFPEFENSVTSAKKEDFQRWDDYMEWKAFFKKYNRLKEAEI